ncbi:MAG: Pr6Pr family membrane protein [Ilumatobacteraceae bacterium]|nr:Pr6Pr family membrane protein [Ilumatobacteraceae bacterium]
MNEQEPTGTSLIRPELRSIVRLAVSMAVVAAIAAQLQFLADNDLLRTVNFFSFFTIDSNILAALVFVGLEFDRSSPIGRVARRCRGAATLYMTMTGIIYAVLLAPIAADVSTQLDWVNAVLHIIVPIWAIADWVTNPPAPAPDRRTVLWWLSFPVAWLTYTVIRGNIVDWYPYPFLDPREDVEHAAGSWPVVIITTLVLTAAVVGLGLGLAWIARRRVASIAAG